MNIPTAVNAGTMTIGSTVKNQLSSKTYDAAGNIDASPMGGEDLVYDAENRIVKVGTTIEYSYDGDGNRVKKDVAGTKTIYFRSAADGSVRKEFVDSGSGYAVDRVYAYLNGSHLASYSPPLGGGWKYTFRDHLGTLRVRVGPSGAVISRHDFYPFGGEHTPPSADEDHLFTDQERDMETGLDYFIARHYGSNIGRFLQIDPDNLGANPDEPQSWNMYAYAGNNPLNFVDPTGEAYDLIGGDECGQSVDCDDEGYVVDKDGARIAISDDALEEWGFRGPDGGLWFTVPGLGTFKAGEWFDEGGGPAAVVSANSYENEALYQLWRAGNQMQPWADVAAVPALGAPIVFSGLGAYETGLTTATIVTKATEHGLMAGRFLRFTSYQVAATVYGATMVFNTPGGTAFVRPEGGRYIVVFMQNGRFHTAFKMTWKRIMKNMESGKWVSQ